MFPAYGGSSQGSKSAKRHKREHRNRSSLEEGETEDADSKPLFSLDKSGSKEDYLITIESSDDCNEVVDRGTEKESGEIPTKRHKHKKSHDHKKRLEEGRKRSRSRSKERYRTSNDYDHNRQGSSRHGHINNQGRQNRSGNEDRYEQDRYRGGRDRDRNQGHGYSNYGQGPGYNHGPGYGYDASYGPPGYNQRNPGFGHNQDPNERGSGPGFGHDPNGHGSSQGPGRRRNNDRSNNLQEEYRLRVSQQFPKKIFLEEVELQPEFAFRVDTNANQNNLTYRSLSTYQTPRYSFERGNVLGATTEDLNKIFRFQPKLRCVPPPGIDDDSNSEEEEEVKKQRKVNKEVDTVEFFSFSNSSKSVHNPNPKGGFNLSRDFESYSFSRRDGEMGIKDKVEYYNSQVRKEPKNIKLWKEFVQFQDQVFEESDQIFETDSAGSSKKGGKKRNRKALVEKKIAVLEKAIDLNPKSLELHMDRMGYLCEIYKPRFVLTEWKKLVTTYQQVSSFWVEYLKFASTQLQLFSQTAFIDVFSKCFQKFRQMFSPNYSDFQRPEKFLVLVSDLFFSVTLILKNSGYMERAVALHQGQLELDFNCPTELLKDKTKQDWKEIAALFELFWNAGTLRFGEPGALGWSDWVKVKSNPHEAQVGILDSTLSEFEDKFFESVSEIGADVSTSKVHNWLFIESCRSKLFWTPWRESCSDMDECDDTQRIVLAEDLIPFLYAIPSTFATSFEMQSTYFRHVVNFMLLLREDFLPSTHSLDSLLASFVPICMSNCQTLLDEVFYWQKFLDLYHCSRTDLESTIPEGFILPESTLPTHHNITASKKLVLESYRFPDDIEQSKEEIMSKNFSRYNDMLQNIIEKSVDSLDQPFATLLVEMYLRFQQKSCRDNVKDRKKHMKFAKNLLKKENLRNATTLYREIALMEYFYGNKSKCVDLLVKTINTANKFFSNGEVEIEANWEQSTEVLRLYRQLAEFYVIENENQALRILASVGNDFESVKLEETVDEDSKPNRNFIMKAKRKFEKVLAKLLSEDEPGSAIQSRYDGDKCIEFLLQKSNFVIEWTCAYGLFEFLLNGFEKASEVFNTVLSGISKGEPLSLSTKYIPAVVNLHHIREQIYIAWCKIGARALSKNLMINSKFRQVLGQALEEFPSSPPLLLLFTDVEKQSSIAGKLWRLMVSIIKQESANASIRWAPLFMCFGLARRIEEIERDEEIGLDTFGLGGPAVPLDTIFYKLDSLLCAAESNIATRNCPLIWRVHLKLLAMRTKQGKDIQRARSVLYDAIRHCPSHKVIYLDGVTYFPEMMQEMSDLMSEKQHLVRLPIQELDVLMEIEGEAKKEKEQTTKTLKSSKNDTIEISDGEVSD